MRGRCGCAVRRRNGLLPSTMCWRTCVFRSIRSEIVVALGDKSMPSSGSEVPPKLAALLLYLSRRDSCMGRHPPAFLVNPEGGDVTHSASGPARRDSECSRPAPSRQSQLDRHPPARAGRPRHSESRWQALIWRLPTHSSLATLAGDSIGTLSALRGADWVPSRVAHRERSSAFPGCDRQSWSGLTS